MTTDVNAKIKEQALAKLARIQRSPNYRSFFTDAAIDAFSKVEGSALAGKSLKREPMLICHIRIDALRLK